MKYTLIILGAVLLFGCDMNNTPAGPPPSTACQLDSAKKQPVLANLQDEVAAWKKGMTYEEYVKSRDAVNENIDIKEDKDKLEKDKAKIADDQAKAKEDQEKLDEDRKKENRKDRAIEDDKDRIAADKANVDADQDKLHEDKGKRKK